MVSRDNALTGEEVGLDVPLWLREMVIVHVIFVTVFDNTAGLNIRQGENLRLRLDAPALLDQLLVGLTREWNDRAIGMNGSALDIIDRDIRTSVVGGVRQLDIAIFFAAFC